MSKKKHAEAPEPPATETPELATQKEVDAALATAGEPPVEPESPAQEPRKPRTRLTVAEKTAQFLAGIEAMKKKHADNVAEKGAAVGVANMALESARAEQAKFLASLKGLA